MHSNTFPRSVDASDQIRSVWKIQTDMLHFEIECSHKSKSTLTIQAQRSATPKMCGTRLESVASLCVHMCVQYYPVINVQLCVQIQSFCSVGCTTVGLCLFTYLNKKKKWRALTSSRLHHFNWMLTISSMPLH